MTYVICGIDTLRFEQYGRRFSDDIFKCIFVNENVWISNKFHLSLSLRVHLSTFQHWVKWWLGAYLATSHDLNQWWLVYCRIYASSGLSELTHWGLTFRWHFTDFKGILSKIKMCFKSKVIELWFYGLIDNKAALVYVMDWRRTGGKSLPEPMTTKIRDAIRLHWANID